ncbi:unnamed protein product [Orchesella dallaii]|uniref:PDZ domain-containing protein n=1 Tax=Orchesella dallaii TaxID=48710 RepID=A0ABP1PY75_9HEXA
MESYSRIRSIKLKRPTPEHPFGFSVRGGHEHGTGIFVSYVDTRSLAYRQGLKVGDQILRVNGYPVSAAVHHECLSLMRTRTSLHLKVRRIFETDEIFIPHIENGERYIDDVRHH